MVFAWLLVYCLKNGHGDDPGRAWLGIGAFVELMFELIVLANKTGVVCQ